MRQLDHDTLHSTLMTAGVRKKIVRELKFVTSIKRLAADWSEYELVPIYDKTNKKGVLLVQPDSKLYAVEFEMAGRIMNSQTGRGQSIVCDFCYTWRPGTSATSITFTLKSGHSVRFLCCDDLECSMHVRGRTNAAVISRSQLHETMSDDERVARLKLRLTDKIDQLQPILL